MKPVYIFSLPRSGSTLVQRVLGRSPRVKTVAEPWVLIPFFTSLKKDTALAFYGHNYCAQAINDFVTKLPEEAETYQEGVKKMAEYLYASLCDDSISYFLDKTPRYHLVATEIIKTFKAEAKYILLLRNPLDVISSIVESVAHGRWNLHKWEIDLFEGLKNIHALFDSYSSQLCILHYESLVSGDLTSWKELFGYLELDFDESYVAGLSRHQINGMGDPTGQKKFDNLSSLSVGKWKNSITSLHRKKWLIHYLDFLGKDLCDDLGYNYSNLRDEINALSTINPMHLIDVPYVFRNFISRYINVDYWHMRKNRNFQNKKLYSPF